MRDLWSSSGPTVRFLLINLQISIVINIKVFSGRDTFNDDMCLIVFDVL